MPFRLPHRQAYDATMSRVEPAASKATERPGHHQEEIRMSAWPVLVTLAALLFYFWTGLMVGNARRKYNVPAPATTGNPDFERVFRVQMNTLEWLPIFLVSMWIFCMYWNGLVGAVIGAIWIVGRYMYAHGYMTAADQRSMGFMIQALAVMILFLGALFGALGSLFGG